MDGKSIHIGGLRVASPLVDITTQVKVERVTAFLSLLTHVLQLHVRQMHRREISQDLGWQKCEHRRDFRMIYATQVTGLQTNNSNGYMMENPND